MKEIEIVVKADGSLLIEGKGFKGAECQKAIEEFTKLLGKVTSRKDKPERWITLGTSQQKVGG